MVCVDVAKTIYLQPGEQEEETTAEHKNYTLGFNFDCNSAAGDLERLLAIYLHGMVVSQSCLPTQLPFALNHCSYISHTTLSTHHNLNCFPTRLIQVTIDSSEDEEDDNSASSSMNSGDDSDR